VRLFIDENLSPRPLPRRPLLRRASPSRCVRRPLRRGRDAVSRVRGLARAASRPGGGRRVAGRAARSGRNRSRSPDADAVCRLGVRHAAVEEQQCRDAHRPAVGVVGVTAASRRGMSRRPMRCRERERRDSTWGLRNQRQTFAARNGHRPSSGLPRPLIALAARCTRAAAACQRRRARFRTRARLPGRGRGGRASGGCA
jgi:hypothetical protein